MPKIPLKQLSGIAAPYSERLTITTQNTIPALAKTPSAANTVNLFINGIEYELSGGAAAVMTLAGKTLTWSATNAGFSLDSTDLVIASYFTFE